MWKIRSCESGSLPVDEVIGGTVVLSQNYNCNDEIPLSEQHPRLTIQAPSSPTSYHRDRTLSSSTNTGNNSRGDSQWHSSSVRQKALNRSQNIGPPRRCDSSELADSPIRAEAIKLSRGLNRAVATHVGLAATLGGSGDGPNLRDDLRRARRTAQESAAAVKATLLPCLLDQRWTEKERMELERLWNLFLCCLDSLEISMHRSLVLLREFSLADGNYNLIHTGLEPPNHHHHHHHSTRQHQPTSSTSRNEKSEVPSDNKLALEGVEASQLSKELFELRAQLQELKSAVEIRSLAIPDFEDVSPTGSVDKPKRIDTLLSLNGTEILYGNPSVSCSNDSESGDSELGSQDEPITSAQRKCICWVLTIMISAFVIAMFIGIFVALFS